LDLGCGIGVPSCKLLSEAGLPVTGVDISSTMLSHARHSVPRAEFIEADMLPHVPDSGAASIDAVVVYFSMIGHVGQEDIRNFFRHARALLKADGIFIYASAPLEGDQILARWMDRDVPCSSFTTEDTLAEIRAAGFEV
ncbi:hypothetical protein CERZMDRAFT_4418, partial [Cercospora zeae-maydis SCOH1-5]